MRKLLWSTLILGLPFTLAFSQPVFAKKAADKAGQAEKRQTQKSQTHADVAYLGIGLESLHPALAAHLPKTLADGRGVLVAQVAPGSPAAKAGIKKLDILVAYQDQKLFSPEQLVKLVQADQPDHKVELQVVREGKMKSFTVTLGERPNRSVASPPVPAPWWQRPWWRELPRYVAPGERPRRKRQGDESTAPSPWESFDSLTLKKLDGNRYRAEINYLNEDGKKEHHQFEGTREEIRSQVKAEKDLPANEREHILRGLDMQDESIMPEFWFGQRWPRELDMTPYGWYEQPDWSSEF